MIDRHTVSSVVGYLALIFAAPLIVTVALGHSPTAMLARFAGLLADAAAFGVDLRR